MSCVSAFTIAVNDTGRRHQRHPHRRHHPHHGRGSSATLLRVFQWLSSVHIQHTTHTIHKLHITYNEETYRPQCFHVPKSKNCRRNNNPPTGQQHTPQSHLFCIYLFVAPSPPRPSRPPLVVSVGSTQLDGRMSFFYDGSCCAHDGSCCEIVL